MSPEQEEAEELDKLISTLFVDSLGCVNDLEQFRVLLEMISSCCLRSRQREKSLAN